MEQDKNPNKLPTIFLILATLIGATFVNKKLKEHGLRIPTITEYLAFVFAFSMVAWIVIIIVAIVTKIATFLF